MAWVAVDKDGTEKISNNVMIRRKNIQSVCWGLFRVRGYSKNNRSKWSDGWSSDHNDALPFNGILLPKGSIEKLIGRVLTWDDEPVELSNENPN